MKITPMDLTRQEFSRRINGYDVKEVREFLMVVRDALEEEARERNRLADEVAAVRRELTGHVEKEEMLKDTLRTAQEVSKGMQNNAQRESDAILGEARVRAQDMVNNAQLRAMEIIDDIKDLKRQKISFESGLKSLIESHGKMLEITREDPIISQVEDKVDFLARKFKKKESA